MIDLVIQCRLTTLITQITANFPTEKVVLIMITWADLVYLMRMIQIVTFLPEILGNPTAKSRTTRSYFYEEGSIPIIRFQSVGN